MRRQNIFGQGLSFPPRVGADGRLAWSEGEENVRESIRVILLTEPAERLMREEFGCGLRRFLFEPNTVTTRTLIREAVQNAIKAREPRVRVETVTVEPDAEDPRLVAVEIHFRLVATQAVGSLGVTLQLEG
ncbi:MAG: GPW/gp25 family protein [Acidobacteria bacterium]|nr:GPW/gp25 family protein [Acidobacteriota bacterium]MCA1620635.1 GPW/gp25 family protein [Acidobacteriota bacterium]